MHLVQGTTLPVSQDATQQPAVIEVGRLQAHSLVLDTVALPCAHSCPVQAYRALHCAAAVICTTAAAAVKAFLFLFLAV